MPACCALASTQIHVLQQAKHHATQLQTILVAEGCRQNCCCIFQLLRQSLEQLHTWASTAEGVTLLLTLPSGYSTLSEARSLGWPAAAGPGPSTSSTGRPTGRMWHWWATEIAVRTWSPVTMAVRICQAQRTAHSNHYEHKRLTHQPATQASSSL